MLLRNGRRSLSLHHAAIFRPLRPTPRFPLTTINASERSKHCFGTKQNARPTTARNSFSAGRNLATTVDQHQSIDDSKYGRLNSSVLPAYRKGSDRRQVHELRAFDPSSPLVIGESRQYAPRSKMNTSGITGDAEEMLPVFHACIRVGKVDRAEMVLKRMSNYEIFPGEELIFLHNRYLRASLDQMRLHPDAKQAEGLHKWYELHIRSKGLPQTAETVACMLKASLLSERDPDRRRRLITRYMGLAPGEAGLQVLSMAEILSDQDLAVITDICPTYNLAPEEKEASALESKSQPESTSQEISDKISSARAQSMPEVLATPQKGFGLKTLKHTLSLFDEIPQNCDISTLPLREQREIQARLERDCIDAAVERWREENESLQKMGLNTSVSHASLNSRLYDWQLALEARLKEEMIKIEAAEAAVKKTPEDYDRCMYGPFLRLSTPSRLAAVTILGTLSSTAIAGVDRGMPISAAIASLAKLAEEDIRAQLATQNATTKSKGRRVVMSKSSNGADKKSPEETSKLLSDAQAKESALADTPWPVSVRAKVGAALLSALIETAKIKVVKEHPETKTLISQFQPAFSHVSQLRKGKRVGMILLNKELISIMKREPQGDYLAKHLPMVVEPEPWQAFDKGGFLESRANLVRIKQGDKDQKLYSEAAIARGDMDQIFKGLDVLGKTAWRVNTPVFNVMLAAWNTGEELANLPALNPDIPVPPEPEASDDPLAHRLWIKAVKAAENERGGLHSVRCFMNFQLEIARAFRNQTFYFPHNIDFRGRAYPLPTYLNHMGADHVRGILRFAKGKELGEEGLKWLKVHLANVFGFDKASLKDRESFAMDNLVNIFDSANKPLDGNRWWLKAEDPWQCLATCFELKAALESPEPTKFVSHLPVHQDGTCNGLQHYAALGGDSWGARQVNLEPGDKPADVYSAVANIVKEHIAKDAEAGNPFAVAMNGKITRKVVKQTVMTNVYGVTFAGAKKQVCKQLDALYPNLPKESGFDNLVTASYVATLVFKALSSMFRGAHDIQYWLGEIGGRVCRALSAEQLERINNDNLLPSPSKTAKAGDKKTTTDDLLAQFRATIVWTTPLRMPIAQPYRKSGTRIIKTSLQDLSLTVPERSDPVHRKKQLQAFPPNFIHSLDATHMLLSALECHDLGLDFAAVHDSFWTHASDVNTMNRVIRDAFVRIHEEDVVGRLAAEFEARYRGSIYLAKVNHGTPVEKKITAFRKQFKMSSREELLMEYKRQTLLRSSDPEQVAEGKKMVTPASIFEEMSAAESLAEPEDMDGLGLGNIPENADEVDVKAESALSEEGIDDEIAAEAPEAEAPEGESAGSQWAAQMLENMKVSYFEQTIVSKPKATESKGKVNTIQVWLPLTFPPIPEKGDFDVQRLKESEYFFS